MHDGPPVWMMLVGPPSSGGSELLNLILEVPGIIEAGLIDSAAAFLSGTSEHEISKDATGGLLRQVGTHGGIVMKDFTSILSLPTNERKKIMGVFRETYDGRWTRPVGSDGGKSLRWEGRCGFFAKSTGAIDFESDVSAALGERWIYFRMEDDPVFERSRRALINSSVDQQWRKDLQQMVKAFFVGLDLHFKHSTERRRLKDYEHARIIRCGEVAAKCRSSVRRDTYHGDIVGIRETEMGTRLTSALGQLYIGLEAIGVPEPTRWSLLGKITLDCMPSLRRKLVEAAAKDETLIGLADRLGTGKRAVNQAIEDLEVHGVVRYVKRLERGRGLEIELTPQMKQDIEQIQGRLNV